MSIKTLYFKLLIQHYMFRNVYSSGVFSYMKLLVNESLVWNTHILICRLTQPTELLRNTM